MGCTHGTQQHRKSRITIVDSPDSNFSKIKQRDGHPTYYKLDGYDIGIRVSSRTNRQTTFIGTSRANGEKVTIKEYHLATQEEGQVVEELVFLNRLNQENLPKLREVFITNTSLFAVTSYIDNLRLSAYVDTKAKSTKFSVQDARTIFQMLVLGVKHCHDNKIIIRSLIPANIMVKKGANGYEAKVIDFSQAVEFGSLKVLYDHPLFDWADVPYMAPEALLGHPYTATMDVWSLGVLLFTMLSGELPFDSAEDNALVDKIKKAEYNFNSAKWNNIEDPAKDLIDRMLVIDESKRFNCTTVLSHPWVTAQ